MAWYCDYAIGDPVHGSYHDTEYGFPETDEARLFERLVLEINQALDENVYTFLTKPLKMEKLFTIIREVLHSKECGEIKKSGAMKP